MDTLSETHCAICGKEADFLFCTDCSQQRVATLDKQEIRKLLKQMHEYLKEELTKLREEFQAAGLKIG